MMLAAVACFAGEEAILKERQKGKLFPVLDPELLHKFEAGTLEDFKSHPLREELKVGYALALSGYWLVGKDCKTAEAYDNFALELAKKYGLKNEEGQAVMGSAMLAESSNDTSNALERISKAILIFKEAGGGRLQCDAMWVQARLQQRNGMLDESIKTLTELQSLIKGPEAEFIKDACRSKIAELNAEKKKHSP